MRTLYVMDPLDSLHITGDSTYVLMRESTSRGWPVWWCTPDQLSVRDSAPVARAQEVTTHADSPFFRMVADPALVSLRDFDCVWMRKDPPFDIDYIFSTYVLDLALWRPEGGRSSTLVLNDPRTIVASNEKMYALQWPLLSPPTLVTNRIADIAAFAGVHGRIVIKPWDGNGGRGVLVTERGDANLRSMAELLTNEGRAYCIAQRYLPEIRDGDKRIILIDGEPRGWFKRVPQPGDHRGNMHVGARVEAFDLSPRDLEICRAIGPRLKAEGLLFVGIDVIGDFLTEINVTSPTGLREVVQLQDRSLGPEILDAAYRRWTALQGED